MGAHDLIQKQHALLSNLVQLPHKIVQLHGNEYLPEFVLHELSHEQCFDLSKVAYFVDNADFNCMKGVAGIDRADHYRESIWDNPQEYM
jgi:predicted SprT family Zn-dependent metalloprotease